MKAFLIALAVMGVLTSPAARAQQQAQQPKPEGTEVWQPVPAVVTPGETPGTPACPGFRPA